MLDFKPIITLAVIFLMCPGMIKAADAPATPQAVLPETVFEFEPVVEGTQVVHDFVIHNRGDATLSIIDLKSG